MTTTVTGEARQAGWIEHDDAGRPVLCVTNTVTIVNPVSAWFLGGAEDRPGEVSDWCVLPDWSALVDLSIRFEHRNPPEVEAFEKEHAAFRALLPNLQRDYGGSFVAIHQGAVVDSDRSREELVKRFFARFGDTSVYIGYVGDPSVAYQLTPFRI